ncbi:MAG: radical SAM protein [Candidatus Lokiarchaeota archaeon]|nr:radical SAM protein [Candidatus Lokiarchaeota archaeon]
MDTTPEYAKSNKTKRGCPYDCGLCENHKSAANLMIVDITNRCNLNCPICFANANRQGKIVEYSYEEVVKIMDHFIKQKPYHTAIAQFSGGEPTLHPDIIKILQKAKDMGFPHRMLNTNGIKMAKSLDFCRQIKETDCGAIYLSFDGLNPETYKAIRGVDLSKVKQKVIKNCRKVGLDGVMLVMTVCKGQNDQEVGNVLKFARDNNDVVAGVVFQPVSLCGRVSMEELRELRYTNSDLVKEIEKVTNGQVKPMNFTPLSASNKLTMLLAWFNDLPQWAMTSHDDCGFCTLVQVNKGEDEWRPIDEYADKEGLIQWANEVYDMVSKREIPKPSGLLGGLKDIADNLGLKKVVDAIGDFSDKMTDVAYRNAMKAYFAAGAIKYIKEPARALKFLTKDNFYMNVVKLLASPSLATSKSMLLHGTLFIGSMHFMDAYNFDTDRVSRCLVHYGVLDPDDHDHVLEIPFCAYNTIHREPLERKWAELHAKELEISPQEHAQKIDALVKKVDSESRK